MPGIRKPYKEPSPDYIKLDDEQMDNILVAILSLKYKDPYKKGEELGFWTIDNSDNEN